MHIADALADLGGTDTNLITGAETSPRVTQNEASVWGHGNTVVAVYQDSSGITLSPFSYCGVSTSTDGGATFTRLPYKFNSGLGSCSGDSSVFYSVPAGKWFVSFLAGGCGGFGVGQWESPDGINWTNSGCIFNNTSADLPSTWIDNNPGSPFYGRQYALFNDFNASGGAPRTVYSTDHGATWSSPATLFAGFRRAVKITGSLGNSGTVFAQLTDEGGGGLSGPRQNLMTRSTDGGATWSAPAAQGATYLGPGRSVSGYFPGMYSAGYWRDLGFGRPAAGPNNIVHYTYSARIVSPADPGNVYYIRSTDNGSTWSVPLKLNTDATTRAQWSPSISTNPNGLVMVSWYDERNTTTDSLQRYGRISTNNGATWDTDFALSDVIFPKPLQPDTLVNPVDVGLYNNAAFSDDNFGNVAYHTWVDGRNSIAGSSQQDVYFDKITFGPPPIITVTTLDDHNDGACNAADCSLREAINDANAAPQTDRILFRPGLTGTVQLGSALPALTTSIILQGPGPNLLTVRRNTAVEHRIFTINNATVTIEGLTISNGNIPASGETGGGIFNNGGALNLLNCAVTGNHGYAGGGLYNANDGAATLSGCTFSGNSAFEGGGIDNAALSGNATLIVINSTFSGNSASSNAGGIGNGAFGGTTASLTLTNCTFSGNSAPTGGGVNNGVAFGGTATTIVRNSIFKTGASGANLANSGGTITSQGSNRSNDSGAGFLVSSGDLNNTDPMIGGLEDNGGPTMTHALLAGSSAINNGNNAFAPSWDQRGFIRVGTSDIGAFEFDGVPLRITNITRVANDIVITFEAVAGKTFALEHKTTTGPESDWQSIPGLVNLTADATGPAVFTHSGGATPSPGFYRVRLLP